MNDELKQQRRKVLQPVLDWLKAGGHHVPEAKINGFDMSEWFHVETKQGEPCGSVCCIAGAVCQFNEPFPLDKYPYGETVLARAERLLQLEEEKAWKLFCPDDAGCLTYVTPEQAVRVVENFMETGEVDWSEAAKENGYDD